MQWAVKTNKVNETKEIEEEEEMRSNGSTEETRRRVEMAGDVALCVLYVTGT